MRESTLWAACRQPPRTGGRPLPQLLPIDQTSPSDTTCHPPIAAVSHSLEYLITKNQIYKNIYYFCNHNNYHQVTIFNRPLFQNVLLASNVDIFFYLHRRVFIWSLCLGLLYLSTVGWYHYQQSRRKGAMVVPQLNDPERNCKQLHFPIIPWGDHIFLPPSSHKQNWQWKN